ncbi:MAG TPA: ABC transporter substrate-binding protein, partial [Candidatus Binataceae bacterium]|nr:ABC transporter substrate-binding protein [Candidatus Binataceae bacterium]
MTIGSSITKAACRGFASSLRLHTRSALAVTFALVFISSGFAPSTARAEGDALGVTQNVVNQALQILGSSSTPLPQRRRELRALVEQNFNFATMSRSALGYNWRSLSPDQRAQFTKLFTAFIEVAYLNKIQDYQGQKVQFSGQRPVGGGYAEVDTKIVQAGKSPIAVNYLLEQQAGTWKIYDVTVEGISIIANYRNQFNRVINEK